MFIKARPVFASGKEKELNYQLVLKTELDSLKNCVLNITAVSFYRLKINGQFVFFGPARAAFGYARVDAVDLSGYDNGKKNEVVIEVAGYYCKSLATVRQPSFIQAEIVRSGEVVLYTDTNSGGFEYFNNTARIQKVDRYSMQRHFGEVWDLGTTNVFTDENKVELSEREGSLIYQSSTPHPAYDCFDVDCYTSRGNFVFDETLEYRECRYSGNNDPELFIKRDWGSYTYDVMPYRPYPWLQRQRMTMSGGAGVFPITLCEGEYAIVDLGKIYAGFLRMELETKEDSDIVVGYSELCTGEEFEFSNINCQNVIEYLIPADKKEKLESFEPYTARYAVVMVKKGSITFTSFGIRKWEFDTSKIIKREIKDEKLRAIYDAGIRAFAHNTVDIYMDCPSRERAGWLCDSFFTSRVEYFLTGNSEIEDAFLENYRLFKSPYGTLPEGMVPECYPSDIESDYIPQWAMWYMIETYEYLTERRPSVDKELFRESLYGLLGFFAKYENSDGLLEKLPGWNFVEWSTANEWVHDVNYPTNFLYSEALERTGKLYGDASLVEKADKIRKLTVEKSFNGELFIDNAVRDENGVLVNTCNVSEAGQYYAYVFGHIDIYDTKYDKLREHFFTQFKALGDNSEHYVTVDCMPGYYLKMLALIELGRLDILEDTITSFFSVMVELTDTLWEYKPVRRKGSYDHGFASYGSIAAYLVDSNKK